jgi:hypothetical protein
MKSIFELVGLAILVTSLSCMFPPVRATAQDAGQGPLSVEQQLIRAQQSILELKEELHKVKQELAAEKAAARQAANKLELENEHLKRRREEMDKRLAELVQSEVDAMARLHGEQGIVAALIKERDRMLTGQAAKPAPRAGADAQRQDDQADRSQVVLEGEVLAAGTFDLIEISLGTDDGLLREEHLELYRLVDGAATWIGRVEVIAVAPDKSVGRLVPELKHGPIRKGDRVTSKLGTIGLPRVEGVVLSVRDPGPTPISVGADDGLLVGHRLEVYRVGGRSPGWMGRVEVIATTPDRSICKIVDSRGTIQEGDRIVPRLETDDPFAGPPAAPDDDPFACPPGPPAEDPFAGPPTAPADDPFASPPGPPAEDPFAGPSAAPDDDPFASPPAPPDDDPFASPPVPPDTKQQRIDTKRGKSP